MHQEWPEHSGYHWLFIAQIEALVIDKPVNIYIEIMISTTKQKRWNMSNLQCDLQASKSYELQFEIIEYHILIFFSSVWL